jgi:hypothetical protein
MTAKIYRFPDPPDTHAEITFIGSLALLAVVAALLSVLAPWS